MIEHIENLTDASFQNPNCDGSGPCSDSEVRFLATGRTQVDGGVILCLACFLREMEWRKSRNFKLADDCKFRIEKWSTLPIYGGSGGVK